MSEQELAVRAALDQYRVCEYCGLGDMRVVSVTATDRYYDVEMACGECQERLVVRVRPSDLAAYEGANR